MGQPSASDRILVRLNSCPGLIQFAAANTDDTETNSASRTVHIAVKRVGGGDGPVSINKR